MDTSSLILSLFLILPLFVAGWWIQERQQDAGWVDVLWAFCVAAVAVFYVTVGKGDLSLRLLTGAIYLLWFGRLGLHLTIRLLESEEEDGRYARMRQWAGKKSSVVFLGFYLMQASWVWIFTLPAWLLAAGRWPPLWCVSAALLVVVVSWWGESVADAQLLDFKRNPSNQQQVCRQGLWRYSRHPNYFFEWCHWFCYPLLGIASYGGGWLWAAPLVMFIFLYFVTGIPFSEQQALSRRGEAYRHYQQTTSMFIPWKPKT
ncbi:hypothetical protein BTA51_02745 [Hahella sp. CCB-MM4]|uniref:DUF1295 domain-containing protein n=1 Tax=Hahella sp. (strain CCB-MM4) TaxID=1926491 RepID=UPI000B9C1EC2|nr:DUF1295 domain-containing protein [Hahella sp. CCB-MM4]OZG75320.1 hypothetical protein BTA51_02745 [Hahella sp. CCB-MM4]